jgi:hypothetical protein
MTDVSPIIEPGSDAGLPTPSNQALLASAAIAKEANMNPNFPELPDLSLILDMATYAPDEVIDAVTANPRGTHSAAEPALRRLRPFEAFDMEDPSEDSRFRREASNG